MTDLTKAVFNMADVKKLLFNINRLINESLKEVPVETSFLEDLNYTVRSIDMEKHKPHYYWKRIDKEPCDFPINNVTEKEEPTKELLGCIIKLTENGFSTLYECVYHDGLPSRTYKPSSLQCIRQMYYQIVGVDVDDNNCSPDLYGIGESGTDRHTRIQNYISCMPYHNVDCTFVDVGQYVLDNNIPDLEIISKNGNETKLHNTKYNLNFLCDGIIKYKGTYYILEIKTESSYKWMSRTGVADEHLIQAYTYSMCLNIPRVLFIYESRDLCSKKTYLIEINDEMRNLVCNKIKSCDNYVLSNIVPPKPEVSKKICQYCNYKKSCRKDV